MTRKYIMIIEGCIEEEGVASPEIVDDLFADFKLDFDPMVCDRVHRKGKKPPETGAVLWIELEVKENEKIKCFNTLKVLPTVWLNFKKH